MSKIILNEKKKPFESEQVALNYVDDFLGGVGEVMEVGTGWGILQAVKVDEKPMTYHRCMIAPRTSDNEDEIVNLSLNGSVIQVKRGEEVILPESHILVAEEAVQEKYELRGSALIHVGRVSVCPITRLGESTKEEYEVALKKGTETRDEEIRVRNLNDLANS